jgi:hypothetical protein
MIEETRITRPSAAPDYIDTVVTEETLSSPPLVVVAHVITDARLVVPLAGVVLLALALLGLSWLWLAGYAGVLLVAFVLVIAIAVGRS